jgi:hypothetical protein
MTKQKPIKAITNFRRMTPEVVVSTSQAIQTHFNNNPNLTGAPPLPVDMAAVKTATDLLAAKIAGAAEGGKTAVAQKQHQKEVVVKLLEQLAHYAEANCKEDLCFSARAVTKTGYSDWSESITRIAV